MVVCISQLQFPSKDSSRLKFAGYFANFVALSILVNPANVLLTFATIFFRAEIKTFYIYKEIKAAKITKKDYWDIFFKNNIIKLISFALFSAFITYLIFTTTFLLVSLLGTIPLTMILILLQSELRPKNFDPITLFKASINFFLEGIKENLRATVNKLDNAYEHLLPHQQNDDIIENIDKLKDKYGEKIPDPEDVKGITESNEYKQFIEYINKLDKLNFREFSSGNKYKIITFLNAFCSNNMKHRSGFTGGQILLLVLRACNDGSSEVVTNKKDALIANLIDSQTFSRSERIPNTCFTGIIQRMLSTLEGMHSDPEIRFTPPKQIFLFDAQNAARKYIMEELKEKKNNIEIFNAWYKVQNNPDDNSQKIVNDFIAEISIPLMKKLLDYSLGYTEEIVLTLMKNIGSIKLNMLEDFLLDHIRNKLRENGLSNQENLFESVKEKVFLELLNKDLLSTQFLVGIFSYDDAEEIADTIIKKEVEEFKLKAAEQTKKVSSTEAQVDTTLRNLSALPRERKCCIAYRELSRQYQGEEKEIMEDILLKKLEITREEMDKMLEENDIFKLKLALDKACKESGKNMEQMIEEMEGFVASRFLNEVSADNVAVEASR